MAAADLALPHVQAGKHLPTQLLGVSYGPDALSSLPVFLSDLDIATDSPVLILTGRSLSSSPLLDLVKAQLGQRLAGVFSSIGQHSPLEGIRKALEEVERTGATVIVGFGGGSVIDAAKAVSYLHQEKHGRYLPQLALPTTLSAAELTVNAGYTNEMGEKVAVRGAELAPKVCCPFSVARARGGAKRARTDAVHHLRPLPHYRYARSTVAFDRHPRAGSRCGEPLPVDPVLLPPSSLLD